MTHCRVDATRKTRLSLRAEALYVEQNKLVGGEEENKKVELLSTQKGRQRKIRVQNGP